MASPARATIDDLTAIGPAQSRVSRASNVAKQAALDAASDYLDGKLGDQYLLPLTAPYPQDVIDFEVVYASYRLLLNLGFNPLPGNADEAIKQEYDKQLKWADNVAAGEISIRGLEALAGEAASGPDVITARQRGYSERGAGISHPGPFSGD